MAELIARVKSINPRQGRTLGRDDRDVIPDLIEIGLDVLNRSNRPAGSAS